jgi:eukaryotic-like serine/threonine-protein kinase
MHLDCPHCGQALEFSGKRPSFCAYCGKSIDQQDRAATPSSTEDDITLPPDPAAPRAAPPPQSLGGYKLLRPLGEGGMGTVYEAEEIATGRHVALKMIAAEHANSPESAERFRREGRLASAIADPRCVFILAANEEAGRPYIVMELMPGNTLKDLIEQRGRLPPGEAVAKILDVIDGLRAAHRLGVIHRDVKPSNCFLEANGRVKIGDFGLSKSLQLQGDLTRTGAFLGTPLFASPEQVRGETVDQQSDLYSVAATLYCMLTGRAPFQSDNAAVTVARIAADPAPAMRTLRPNLPEALDSVVLRGLDRDRHRRWRDLDAFRAALLPFVPGTQAATGLGVRFGAFLIDYFVLMAGGFLIALGMFLATGQLMRKTESHYTAGQMGLGGLMWLLYFGVPECLWGCSLGKWLLRLRVCNASQSTRAAPWRILLRTLLLYVLANLGGIAAIPIMWGADDLPPDQQMGRVAIFLIVFYPLLGVGIGLLVCTMRARNGYQCLHEWLSGTRVVPLPALAKRVHIRSGPPDEVMELDPGLPARIGAFTIRGMLPWRANAKVLVGDDTALGRRVLVVVRPEGEPPLNEARRAIARPVRLRWLAGGCQDGQQWEAFMAPTGQPLREVVAEDSTLPWSEVGPILEYLADELAAAGQDGTLPQSLCLDQVRLQVNGQVELVDWPPNSAEPPTEPVDQEDGSASGTSRQALALLAEVAVQALQGRQWRPSDAQARKPHVHAPLPVYAAKIMGRLLGSPKSYADLREFQGELLACRDRPAEVTPGRRIAHVAVLAAMLGLAVCSCMLPAGWVPGFLAVVFLTVEMEHEKEALQNLERGAYCESAVAVLNPNPLQRLRAAAQLEADLRLRDQLQQQISQCNRERQARVATNQLLQTLLTEMDKELLKQHARAESGKPSMGVRWVGGFRSVAAMHVDQPRVTRQFWSGLGVFYGIQLLFWPVIWVVWAFIWRGGFSLGWLGLALVRGDGRRAARWQCALRALLIWAPVTALWAASLALDIWYWSTWQADHPEAWAQWLSSGLWWAGLALLPLYALMALLFPRRGWHDWLAGTYLVPR